MNIKGFFQKNWIHFAAIGLFIIVGYLYFSPQFDDYGIKQHDIEQHKGMSNEAGQYREVTGDEPLWTNSMFGGMPAVQISTAHHGNLVKDMTSWFLKIFPIPMGAFLLHLICFYIFAMFLRIKPIIAIVGALAFAFASYEIIILQAGHNTKSIAVAFLPAVLGAFIYAFRTNWKIGAALSALFMAFEVAANHLQVTYYMGFLLLALGIYFLVEAVRKKEIKKFAFATTGLLAAYFIAFLMNYGNIAMTNNYGKYTTRGGNDITISANGEESTVKTSGLDKEYITQWSYGKAESFTFVSPYVMGSHSGGLVDSPFEEMADNLVDQDVLSREERAGAEKAGLYWGEQPGVAGPFYMGVVIIFLAFLAFFFVKDRKIWVFAAIGLLALLLSWGKNFMGFTEFFIDNIPGYNKFRTVTIVLVLVELLLPVLAVMLLHKLYNEREQIKEKKKLFLIASGVFMVFLIGLKYSGGNFQTSYERDVIDIQKENIYTQISEMDPAVLLSQYKLDVSNKAQVDGFVENQLAQTQSTLDGIRKVRKEMHSKSTTRSIVVGFFTIGICALFFFTTVPSVAVVAGLIVVLLVDLVPVNLNYLGKQEDAKGNFKQWVLKSEKEFPIRAGIADMAIMEAELKENPDLQKAVDEGEKLGSQKAEDLDYSGKEKRNVVNSYKFQALNRATNYRVYDRQGSFGSSRTAYFHKSLGGYHGAKLRNIQNVYEFQMANGNNRIYDMMNVKYLINNGEMSRNYGAMGNAWAVKKVHSYDTPNEELRALGRKYKVKSMTKGRLFVNDNPKDETNFYGLERIVYLNKDSDSVLMDIPNNKGELNALAPGQELFFVSDVKGNLDFMLGQTLNQDPLKSFVKLAKITLEEDVDLRQDAVMLKSESSKLSTSTFTGDATLVMSSYKPNEIKYTVSSKGNQLIVFSEVYYPDGWTATVDGKEQEILKVNYLLRGLELKEGAKEVIFKYDDPRYHSAIKIAYTGSFLLFLLVGGSFYLEYRSRKKKKETKVEA